MQNISLAWAVSDDRHRRRIAGMGSADDHTLRVSVQILDGVGAGLQSAAVPGLVARILDRTGRVNVGQGAVMTVQGLGASLSPALGGWFAQEIGYSAMFLILGGFALGSIALWLGFAPILKPACVRRPGAKHRPAATALAAAQ
jgi:MFS family permease